MSLNWFCICTKSQQEIRASVEISKQGFEVYFPVEHREKIHKGVRINTTSPLYPRYIFARFDRAIPGWQPIRNTRGVSFIISDPDNRPIPLKDHVMDVIRAYKPPEGPIDATVQFSQGQRVQVSTGPLAGLEGLFVADKQKRVSCLLEIMGKRVEMPLSSVRAA